MFSAPVAPRSRKKKTIKFSAKNRYDHDTNFTRGRRATSAAKAGFDSETAMSVPVQSHGRLSTPPATPASSRIGRMT